MFSKINVGKIVRDHLSTLRDNSTGRVMFSDYLLFFVLPLLPPILLALRTAPVLDSGAISLLVTSLSVFAALLFNLLLLVYDLVTKEERTGEEAARSKAELMRQLYSNVSFSILIAITSVALLMILYFLPTSAVGYDIVAAAAVYLLGLFLLTLLMVLKRVHVLLAREF